MRKGCRDAVRCEFAAAVPFDALTCVAEGDCAEYVDGACMRCKEGMHADSESGACVTSGSCKVTGIGVCLRRGDGMNRVRRREGDVMTTTES